MYLLTWLFKKRFYLFIFREKGREGEREGEEHQCVVASHMPPTGDLAHSPSMCPNWESNWWPFHSQACVQSSELHQPGLMWLFRQDQVCSGWYGLGLTWLFKVSYWSICDSLSICDSENTEIWWIRNYMYSMSYLEKTLIKLMVHTCHFLILKSFIFSWQTKMGKEFKEKLLIL